MKNLFVMISSFSGGALVGGAFVAFVTLINIIPRLAQSTETRKYLTFYEIGFAISTFIFTIIYFSDFAINIKYLLIPIGFFFGVYMGLLSSALAEVLNVIPAISKKFKIKKQLKIISFAIMLGKVCGSLYYFVFSIGG